MTVPAASPIQSPRPAQSKSGLVPYRLTVRQFDKMIDAGVFRDSDHVELLGGLLVKQMTKYEPHDFAVGAIGDILRGMLSKAEWNVREEKSAKLGRYWRPEPDIAVARGPRDRYRSKCPRAADLWFVVEVAESSYAKDRGLKWRGYAAAGISMYWIVNVPLSRIEIYTEPSGKGKSAAYASVKVYEKGDEVPVLLDGRELGRFKVSDVLA
jgi:Uma2 family endonuclease